MCDGENVYVYVYMGCYGVIVEQVLSWTKRGVVLCLVCAAYVSEEQTQTPHQDTHF